eukprot:Gb_09859 [translate_table: standard]
MDTIGERFTNSLLAKTEGNLEALEAATGHERYIYEEEEDLISRCSSNRDNYPHLEPSSPTPTTSLLHKDYKKLKSSRMDELRHFRTSLKWWGLDQSTKLNRVFSWFAFLLFTVIVPVLSSFLVVCPRRDAEQGYAFDRLVQIPESTLAAIAFLCLTRYVRKYGLRRFLFLDQLCDDTPQVQQGYTKELDKALKLLAWILLPSFLVELLHKILWFSSVNVTIPYIHGRILSNSIMFAAVLISWLYRTGVFLLVCMLFRLTCHLQILRFEGFRKFLEEYSSDVSIILKEHMRIRHQLFLTSHRFRMFVLASLLTMTVSQFATLVIILSSKSEINFFNAGDLVVCSAVQLTGFLLCLLGAAKITHRAQGTVSVATRWHALATCTSYGVSYSQTENCPSPSAHDESSLNPYSAVDSASDSESSEVFFMFPSKDASAAFQIRQAFGNTPRGPDSVPDPSWEKVWLGCGREMFPSCTPTIPGLVKYLQHNNGGITLYGFVLDRGLLHTLFAFEFSLVMWILSKAVALS